MMTRLLSTTLLAASLLTLPAASMGSSLLNPGEKTAAAYSVPGNYWNENYLSSDFPLLPASLSVIAIPEIKFLIPNIRPTITMLASMYHQAMNLDEYNLSPDVLELALKGFDKLSRREQLKADSILTIVDFSKPSDQKRFYVLDLRNQQVLYHTLVAHGQNTGGKYAQKFSNRMSSHMSSLGFYVTLGTYRGENGYSLKLKGVERGFNDKAYQRAIVVHGAPYAETTYLQRKGMLGRSWGCPAVPLSEAREIIDVIKEGTVLFVYHPTSLYKQRSQLLKG